MHIHPLITDTASLEKLCERLARAPFVTVDTAITGIRERDVRNGKVLM